MTRWLRRPSLPDRLTGAIAGSVGILATAGILWLLYAVVYTPTTTLYVLDDLPVAASLSVCASDEIDLTPGDKAAIDPNVHDPNGGCAVYVDTPTSHYIGCLPVPTTRYRTGAVIALSRLNKRTTVGSCGD
jgi:hypothetical protein